MPTDRQIAYASSDDPPWWFIRRFGMPQKRRCGACNGTGHKQGPPLNHAPDTVVGVGYPKCERCKGEGRV